MSEESTNNRLNDRIQAVASDHNRPRPRASSWAQWGGIFSGLAAIFLLLDTIFGQITNIYNLPNRMTAVEAEQKASQSDMISQGNDIAAIKAGVNYANKTLDQMQERLNNGK